MLRQAGILLNKKGVDEIIARQGKALFDRTDILPRTLEGNREATRRNDRRFWRFVQSGEGHLAHSWPHLRISGIYTEMVQTLDSSVSRGTGMNQRSFHFRGLALFLAVLVSLPAWTATPTIAPQLPDPGSVGITKEQ